MYGLIFHVHYCRYFSSIFSNQLDALEIFSMTKFGILLIYKTAFSILQHIVISTLIKIYIQTTKLHPINVIDIQYTNISNHRCININKMAA